MRTGVLRGARKPRSLQHGAASRRCGVVLTWRVRAPRAGTPTPRYHSTPVAGWRTPRALESVIDCGTHCLLLPSPSPCHHHTTASHPQQASEISLIDWPSLILWQSDNSAGTQHQTSSLQDSDQCRNAGHIIMDSKLLLGREPGEVRLIKPGSLPSKAYPA